MTAVSESNKKIARLAAQHQRGNELDELTAEDWEEVFRRWEEQRHERYEEWRAGLDSEIAEFDTEHAWLKRHVKEHMDPLTQRAAEAWKDILRKREPNKEWVIYPSTWRDEDSEVRKAYRKWKEWRDAAYAKAEQELYSQAPSFGEITQEVLRGKGMAKERQELERIEARRTRLRESLREVEEQEAALRMTLNGA